MSVKAFFIDIDGTLIDGARGPFPDDLAALEAAHGRGDRIILATGRSPCTIPRRLREAAWLDGIVAGCGAYVSVGGEVLHRACVPPHLLAPIASLFLANGRWCVFEGERITCVVGVCGLFVYKPSPRVITGAGDFAALFPGEPITKITMEGFLTPQERAVFEPGLDIIEFAVYSEAIVAGESKVAGMDRVLSALGLSREDAVAIGDSENDLGLLRAAGLGVAMGNARAAVKACAGRVVAAVGQGGVAQALSGEGTQPRYPAR